MNEKEISEFLESLGEIWRDITAIEFLMRCAIAKKDNDGGHFPKPPYIKGEIYHNYPDSFSHFSFEIVTTKFNQRFPQINIPKEIIELRDAMAHGIIAGVNQSGNQLLKFKENKEKTELRVEFSMDLEQERLSQIRQSLRELRRRIANEIRD